MLILLFFMTLSLAVSWFVISFTSQDIMSNEKEDKLLAVASLLDFALGNRSYDDILAAKGAQDASREDKIKLLNLELSAFGDSLTTAHPALGIGYYSLELDAILTYAPSAQYSQTIGTSIAEDHPGRVVMQTGQSMIRTGTMVRGNIMNAMHPISRGGIVIGYAWANELASTIETQYQTTTTSILFILVVLYLFSITIAIIFARRSTRDIQSIVQGVRFLRSDLSHTLPKASGDLGEVVDSINAMATDILKAEDEHKARLLAEASNYAQRDFLSRMSHELRTPMNGVLGMTRLAQNAENEEQCMNYLGKIHTSATLLLRIIDDILDISKIEAGKMTIESHPFQIDAILDNLRDMILPRTQEKGLDFQICSDSSVPKSAIGDGLRISQVLLNIVGNAVKFTAQGSIRLFISAQTLSPGRLRLDFVINDTGIGMDEDQQQSIFTPFIQADSSTARKFGGTGLGLSISKTLVDLMGGEIRVESVLGKGSTFLFHVVVAVDDNAMATTENSTVDIPDKRYDGLNLLLVEDNEINQEIASMLLSELGFSVDVADNGQLGVEAFCAKEYDVIFMDIRMPIMDGIEAAKEIRRIEQERESAGQTASHMPIIAMTANAMAEDREATRAAGMDGHVSKPIDEKEIRRILLKALC